MSEKKPITEEVLQRIDQVLVVLRDILQDLSDISRTLKATVPTQPSAATAPVSAPMPAVPAGALRSAKDVQTMFPTELEDMLNFTETPQYIIIKPRRFLGSDNFAKIAAIVRSNGGEYISAGKESHFRIPRETR
jgi:hypothetical protein